MEPRILKTNAGDLALVPASVDQLRPIARYWPMELIGNPDAPGIYGLVFQRGDIEVHGIKMQPPDVEADDARLFHFSNRILIAAALPHYIEKQHPGVMLPAAYYKEKPAGKVETGIAFFTSAKEKSKSHTGEMADMKHQPGLEDDGMKMALDMAGAISKASKDQDLPLMQAIGLDWRPRLAMGGLAMQFLVAGQQVFVIQESPEEKEPVWDYAVRGGFSELLYAPMKPAALENEPPQDTPRI